MFSRSSVPASSSKTFAKPGAKTKATSIKPLTLTPHQAERAEHVQKYLRDKQICLLTGGAGTGKTAVTTWLIAEHLRNTPNVWVVVAAPTNKAVRVAQQASTVQSVRIQYTTVHRLLGMKMREEEDRLVSYEALSGSLLHPDYTLVVCDEASMLNRKSLQAFYRKMEQWKNTQFLFLGDSAQLNPVGEEASEIFKISEVVRLEEVIRQKSPGLVQIVQHCRRFALNPELGPYQVPEAAFKVGRFRKATADTLIRRAAEFHKQDDWDGFRVLCYTNERVDWYNREIRQAIHGSGVPPFLVGERLLTRSPIKLEQGMIPTSSELTIISTEEVEHDTFQLWKLKVAEDIGQFVLHHEILVLDPNKENLNRYEVALRHLAQEAQVTKFWKDYWSFKEAFADVRPCYSLTVHNSQGSTFSEVGIDQSDLEKQLRIATRGKSGDELMEAIAEGNRLWYVALTRSKEGIWMAQNDPLSRLASFDYSY